MCTQNQFILYNCVQTDHNIIAHKISNIQPHTKGWDTINTCINCVQKKLHIKCTNAITGHKINSWVQIKENGQAFPPHNSSWLLLKIWILWRTFDRRIRRKSFLFASSPPSTPLLGHITECSTAVHHSASFVRITSI